MSYIYPGIVIGALYALLGGSLTLTFSLTGVINLAVGAMSYASAYLFFHLVTLDGWPRWLAGATCVTAAMVLGFVLWLLIFGRLEKRNLVVQLTATIGLAVAIPAMMQLALPIETVYQTPGILPEGFHGYSWGFLNSTRDQLAAVVGAGVCVVALVILVEKSHFGLSARAVVDRPALAEGVGIDTTRLSAVTWVIASAMTGVAGILLSPLIQLDAAQYTTLSVAALSVALVGRFRSLVVTAVAGVGLGVAASLVTGYAPVGSVIGNGLVPALPFFFLLVVLLLVGRSLAGVRQDAATDPVRLSLGPLDEPHGPGRRTARRVILAAILVGLTCVAMFAFDDYWTGVFAAGMSFAVIFLGFTVSTGEGGILCLGQAGFAAAGAFVAGRLATEANVPLVLAVVVGVAAAMACGIVIGLMGARLDHVGFALVTLAFALFCEKFIFNVQSLVPLSGVIYPQFRIFGLRPTQSSILLGAVVFAVVAALLTWAQRGRFGRIAAAVRSNPVEGESIGINVKGTRVGIFAVGSAIGGLGGALVGIQQGAVGISDFALLIGLVWLAVVVTVGVRGYRGALVAGLMFTILPALLQYVHVRGIGHLATVLFGLGAIGLAREPRGLLYDLDVRLRRRRSPHDGPGRRARAGGDERRGDRTARGGRPVSRTPSGRSLELTAVTVRFGGLTALRDVSFHAESGEIVGLIGPNGSGKTTLLNVVSGLVRPAAGDVRIGATSCRRVSVHRRVHLGLARTFQRASLFAELSIREHLTLAGEAKHVWRRTSRARSDAEGPTAEFEEMLWSEPWDLDPRWPAGSLSLGGTRAVELAMALVVPPRVLLLDEPLSGLDAVERDAFAKTLRDVRERLGVTIVLVEHDVESVVQLADRLVVLDFGVNVAAGTTSEILTNTRVREAYLGSGQMV